MVIFRGYVSSPEGNTCSWRRDGSKPLLSMAMQQDPKMEVPTIYKAYKAYVRGYTPENMAKHMVRLRTSILGSWRPPIDYYWLLPYFGI